MRFDGRVLIVGYGSIAQALSPLLIEKLTISPSRIATVTADEDGRAVAARLGIHYENLPLKPDNYEQILASKLTAGDLLINLSVNVSSLALIAWCRERNVLYVDTCIEPWAGGYDAANASTSNYILRHEALALYRRGAPTAVVAHGANPGLISHLTKAGLLELSKLKGISPDGPWSCLAQALGIQVVQIAEWDTQTAHKIPACDEFFNTWSVDGFLSEAWQCAELGWGSHEDMIPETGFQHDCGDGSGIYFQEHSGSVRVASWTPCGGSGDAFLVAHHEALSIASMLTVPGIDPQKPRYRPTTYYAYRPCPEAEASLNAWMSSGWQMPSRKQVLRESLVDGFDELGALFIFPGGAYWHGSTLSLDEARTLVPFNSATSLQVVAGLLGALLWMFKNPRAGVVEAETMNHEEVLAVALPYLGRISGVLTDWQPSADGNLKFSAFRQTKEEFCEAII